MMKRNLVLASIGVLFSLSAQAECKKWRWETIQEGNKTIRKQVPADPLPGCDNDSYSDSEDGGDSVEYATRRRTGVTVGGGMRLVEPRYQEKEYKPGVVVSLHHEEVTPESAAGEVSAGVVVSGDPTKRENLRARVEGRIATAIALDEEGDWTLQLGARGKVGLDAVDTAGIVPEACLAYIDQPTRFRACGRLHIPHGEYMHILGREGLDPLASTLGWGIGADARLGRFIVGGSYDTTKFGEVGEFKAGHVRNWEVEGYIGYAPSDSVEIHVGVGYQESDNRFDDGQDIHAVTVDTGVRVGF